MSTKPPFWATLFTIAGLIVLCALGMWQLQRLQWKTEIIEKLDAAYAGQATAALDLQTPLSYGRASGVFQPSKAILLGPRTREGKIGNDLIVPLLTKDGALLVNMGWTDASLDKLPIHHLEGKNVAFTGLLRQPGGNAFTPDNVPAKDLWYRADPAEIAIAKKLENVAPLILYAESSSYKFDASFPNNERYYPRNQHLQYAMFWFTLAGTLAVIYALRFLRKS